jgi:hypothetical protein
MVQPSLLQGAGQAAAILTAAAGVAKLRLFPGLSIIEATPIGVPPAHTREPGRGVRSRIAMLAKVTTISARM